MTPWTLHLGDCLDPATGLASLPDKSVDHVICDPPYSAKLHAGHAAKVRMLNGYRVPEITFDSASPEVVAAICAQIARVCRRWAVIFCDEIIFGEWVVCLGEAGLEYVRQGAWVKTDPQPQISGDRPSTGTELIALAHGKRDSGRMRWNGGGKPAVYAGHRIDEDRFHPTQKPNWLMEALVRDFTDAGDLILDPFAGSGTTGVAAVRLGRRFVGWERDPKYHAVATRRLAGTREQLSLLGPRAKPKQQALDLGGDKR